MAKENQVWEMTFNEFKGKTLVYQYKTSYGLKYQEFAVGLKNHDQFKYFYDEIKAIGLNLDKSKERNRYLDYLKQYGLFYYNQSGKSFETVLQARQKAHRQVIQKAISEGKPIPENVLAEYPELKQPNEIPTRKNMAEKKITDYQFNGKIYGKSGNYNIYVDNKKISVTDDQVKEYKDLQNEIKSMQESLNPLLNSNAVEIVAKELGISSGIKEPSIEQMQSYIKNFPINTLYEFVEIDKDNDITGKLNVIVHKEKFIIGEIIYNDGYSQRINTVKQLMDAINFIENNDKIKSFNKVSDFIINENEGTLLLKQPDQLSGGLSDNLTISDIAEKHDMSDIEVQQALKIEEEHKDTLQKVYDHELTPEQAIISTINDHESEFDNYYDPEIGLPAMEEKLKAEKSINNPFVIIAKSSATKNKRNVIIKADNVKEINELINTKENIPFFKDSTYEVELFDPKNQDYKSSPDNIVMKDNSLEDVIISILKYNNIHQKYLSVLGVNKSPEIKITSTDYTENQLSELCEKADKEVKVIIAEVEDDQVELFEKYGFKIQ